MFALSAEEWEIIRLSLKVAFWSVLWSLPFALAVAMLLARARFPGKSFIDAIVHRKDMKSFLATSLKLLAGASS